MIDEHTLAFIREHTGDDVRQLALQAARYPLVDMRVAATQIEGRRLAAAKLPAWAATDGVMYPVRLSMEQCSSEATARYKASLVGGSRLADLTGGFGIDCSSMSERFDEATYIERNEELCRIARHNFGLLGLPIRVVNGNSAEVLPSMPVQDWIFLDPARRDGVGNKVVALSDCEPDVCQLEKLLLQKAVRVMVKCSPMLDISLAISQLTSVREVHVVSVGNECKELLLILGGTTGRGIEVRTVNFQGGGVQTFGYALEEEQEAGCSYTNTIGRYLYEPNSSVMKAGCFRLIGKEWGVHKLHPNTHLYTSDSLMPDFPGRILEVKGMYGFSKSELKRLSSEISKANVVVRNFPSTTKELCKRLRLDDGGECFLYATTLADGERVIVVAEKVKTLD